MAASGTITDGRTAWAEFFSGVTGAFEANESALPTIGLVIAALVVLALNVALARWILARWERFVGPARDRSATPRRRSRRRGVRAD